MKLHLLRYFSVLAEELHFGRAADRLAITQPPLSSAIKALEDELGVRLLERDSKHVALTPAGAAFLAEVRVILERIDRASETVRAVAGGLRGRLDVGITGSMVYREVPSIVKRFAQRMPGIEVTLREMSTSEQLDALQHGQLHAGFINSATVPDSLSSLPLNADPLVCCLPADHPLATADKLELTQLAQERFVMFSRDVSPANHDNVVAAFSRAGIHPRMCHATRQWLTILALVAKGMGVSLVPACMANAVAAGVRFVPLSGPVTLVPALLAWPADQRMPALAAFVSVAQEVLEARGVASPETAGDTHVRR